MELGHAVGATPRHGVLRLETGGADGRHELLDSVVHELFGLGMTLQALAQRSDRPVDQRVLQASVEEIDQVIHDLREALLEA